MKLTKWIPGDVKPVRVGVYERSYGNALPAYCYWDGKFWGMYGPTPNQAVRWKMCSKKLWTGIAIMRVTCRGEGRALALGDAWSANSCCSKPLLQELFPSSNNG